MAKPTSDRQLRPRRADVRRRLLDAAVEVFAEKGLDGASLDDVAAAAGLTKGAIYSNFAGKDALIYELMDREIGRRERLADAAAHDAADSDPVRAAATALGVAQQSQGAWQRLFLDFWLRAQRDPDVHAQFARRRRAARDTLARRIGTDLERHGLTSGLTPEELAVTVLALSNGLALERSTDADLVPDDLLGKLFARLLD